MTIETMHEKLKKRFSDLTLEAFDDDKLIIFGLPFNSNNHGNWKIAISKHSLEFRDDTDIDADLIGLAKDFKKAYFTV